MALKKIRNDQKFMEDILAAKASITTSQPEPPKAELPETEHLETGLPDAERNTELLNALG